MFIAALFTIARTWKQPRCPSADEWIRKLWYIYTMEYYSPIKKNTFESVLIRWMKLEPIIKSEVSQKDKHKYIMLLLLLLLLLRCFSRVWLCWTTQTAAHQAPPSLGLPSKNTGVGCHFLLQCMNVKSLSHVRLSAIPWTAAYQAPPSMGFSKQEYWSGVPLPFPISPRRT